MWATCVLKIRVQPVREEPKWTLLTLLCSRLDAGNVEKECYSGAKPAGFYSVMTDVTGSFCNAHFFDEGI